MKRLLLAILALIALSGAASAQMPVQIMVTDPRTGLTLSTNPYVNTGYYYNYNYAVPNNNYYYSYPQQVYSYPQTYSTCSSQQHYQYYSRPAYTQSSSYYYRVKPGRRFVRWR